MATEKQRLANRLNAQKSTGPRTPEGLARSSSNSYKHGLTARHSVLSYEDRVAFEEFRADMIDEHQPVGTQELLLVTQICEAWTRIMRIRGMEIDLYERDLADCESATPNMTLLACTEESRREHERLRRYESQANSLYFRSINTLSKLQNQRRKHEKEEEEADRRHAAYMKDLNTPRPRPTNETANPEIGFVSSYEPEHPPEPPPVTPPPAL